MLKKCLSPIVLLLLLVWSRHIIHGQSSSNFEIYAGLQNELIRLLQKKIGEKLPQAKNISVRKIWTEPLGENQVQAYVTYSFDDPNTGGKDYSHVEINAQALLVRSNESPPVVPPGNPSQNPSETSLEPPPDGMQPRPSPQPSPSEGPYPPNSRGDLPDKSPKPLKSLDPQETQVSQELQNPQNPPQSSQESQESPEPPKAPSPRGSPQKWILKEFRASNQIIEFSEGLVVEPST